MDNCTLCFYPCHENNKRQKMKKWKCYHWCFVSKRFKKQRYCSLFSLYTVFTSLLCMHFCVCTYIYILYISTYICGYAVTVCFLYVSFGNDERETAHICHLGSTGAQEDTKGGVSEQQNDWRQQLKKSLIIVLLVKALPCHLAESSLVIWSFYQSPPYFPSQNKSGMPSGECYFQFLTPFES